MEKDPDDMTDGELVNELELVARKLAIGEEYPLGAEQDVLSARRAKVRFELLTRLSERGVP